MGSCFRNHGRSNFLAHHIFESLARCTKNWYSCSGTRLLCHPASLRPRRRPGRRRSFKKIALTGFPSCFARPGPGRNNAMHSSLTLQNAFHCRYVLFSQLQHECGCRLVALNNAGDEHTFPHVQRHLNHVLGLWVLFS